MMRFALVVHKIRIKFHQLVAHPQGHGGNTTKGPFNGGTNMQVKGLAIDVVTVQHDEVAFTMEAVFLSIPGAGRN